MSKKNPKGSVLGPKAMELVMRDVLGGMEDLAVMKSFESINNVFEIISITPAEHDSEKQPAYTIPAEGADIIPLYKKAKD
jgi:hypothetical protein